MDTFGVELHQAAHATLNNIGTNGVGFQNLATALGLDGSSHASVNDVIIQRQLPAGCTNPRPSVDVQGTASLTANGMGVNDEGQASERGLGEASEPGVGINTMSAGAITLNNSGVTGYAKAIVDGGQGNLFVDKSAGFTRCLVCVDAESTQGLIGISNAFVNTGGVAGGIGIIAPGLKLRNSDLSNNDTGVEITGTFADLGSPNDPGNNDLASCQTTCVLVPKNDTGTFVSAIGNTWNPLVQEADANGHYSGTAAFFGFQGPFFAGRNFTLKGDPSEEILTSSAFGEASVTPRTLHQKASHSARLKVSWTHPRSWRKLRSIQLRLYRGARVVAQLTINPRHPHLTDTGTLRLLAVTHDRKTVTGTVTVRPGRALAGRTLRVAVQATDIHGQRQLEPDVGSIHVAA